MNCEFFINQLHRIRKAKTVLITICAPSWKEIKYWGDYYFAKSLAEEFKRKGFNYKICLLDEIDRHKRNFDIHIFLRGIRQYAGPKMAKTNILWQISHPEIFSSLEYNQFDFIFVASKIYAQILKKKIKKHIFFLPQATDIHLFYYDYCHKFNHDVVFIGNTRGIFRPIIKEIIKAGCNIKIWGQGWNKFVDKKYIVGDYFPNDKLRLLYSSAKIVINDHWRAMKKYGFVNNRTFDILACNGIMITDYIEGINDLFKKNIIYYRTKNDFINKLKYYLQNQFSGIKLSRKAKEIVIKNHTFNSRVSYILKITDNFPIF